MPNSFYRHYGKRLFDLMVSLSALIVLSPVLTVTAVLVRVLLGSPIIFRQDRPGYRSRVFHICKFRTMSDARDVHGDLLDDSLRHTAFGKFLRSSSLDELPELWNVLRGEMSLVGPRPLRTHFLPYYSPEQARRHDVIPGITGWAQVNGRNQLSWEDRFQCDVWYVDNCNFLLDLKILWMTIVAVFKRTAIDAADGGEFPDFTGTKVVEETSSCANDLSSQCATGSASAHSSQNLETREHDLVDTHSSNDDQSLVTSQIGVLVE